MRSISDKEWHHLEADTITVLLESNLEKGLDVEEVRRRLDRFGSNTLTAKLGKSSWMRFLLQFHQPLIYILIAAGAITAALQEWVDSGVIFGVVLVNAIIGFIQESKAENALAALADTMVAEATVLRQGEKKTYSISGTGTWRYCPAPDRRQGSRRLAAPVLPRPPGR